MALIITDQNFEAEVLKSKDPVLVDFFAPWCGPCQMLGPVIDKLAEEYSGKPVKIVKVDVDASPATAQKYEIMSIPTLIVLKAGQVVNTMQGMQAETDLKRLLDGLIK